MWIILQVSEYCKIERGVVEVHMQLPPSREDLAIVMESSKNIMLKGDREQRGWRGLRESSEKQILICGVEAVEKPWILA